MCHLTNFHLYFIQVDATPSNSLTIEDPIVRTRIAKNRDDLYKGLGLDWVRRRYGVEIEVVTSVTSSSMTLLIRSDDPIRAEDAVGLLEELCGKAKQQVMLENTFTYSVCS